MINFKKRSDMEEKKWIAIARETLRGDNGEVSFIKGKPYKVLNRSEYVATLINEQENSFSIGSRGWYYKFQFVEVPREEDSITFEVGKKESNIYDELIRMAAKIVGMSIEPEFKDGEFIMANDGTISILGKKETNGCFNVLCRLYKNGRLDSDTYGYYTPDFITRKATESECQQILGALAKECKRWNAEAKRIEDLEWKPQRGEVVKTMCGIFIFDEDGEPYIKGLNRLFYNTDGVIEISKCKFMCKKSQLEPTTPEERGEFFESLTKAGWKYNSRKVELKKVKKPVIKDFDFSKLKKGDFVSYEKINGEEWFSVVDKVENGILYEMVTTLGICSIEGFDQPIRYIDPASVKVLNRKID